METVRTIKGFDNELKCRGFQYEIGKTYTAEGKIEVCSNGFHAIRNDVNPLSVFEYYAPVSDGKPSRYCTVECSGEIKYDDNKLCCSTITIVEEITLDKLHELSQAWVESQSVKTETGGYGSALRGGDGSALRGGDRSALTGGDWSALRGGYRSALRGGYRSKFCGGKWSTFFVEIINVYGEITGIATAVVDGVNYKENQWYEFDTKKGEWTECSAPDNAID